MNKVEESGGIGNLRHPMPSSISRPAQNTTEIIALHSQTFAHLEKKY